MRIYDKIYHNTLLVHVCEMDNKIMSRMKSQIDS